MALRESAHCTASSALPYVECNSSENWIYDQKQTLQFRIDRSPFQMCTVVLCDNVNRKQNFITQRHTESFWNIKVLMKQKRFKNVISSIQFWIWCDAMRFQLFLWLCEYRVLSLTSCVCFAYLFKMSAPHTHTRHCKPLWNMFQAICVYCVLLAWEAFSDFSNIEQTHSIHWIRIFHCSKGSCNATLNSSNYVYYITCIDWNWNVSSYSISLFFPFFFSCVPFFTPKIVLFTE